MIIPSNFRHAQLNFCVNQVFSALGLGHGEGFSNVVFSIATEKIQSQIDLADAPSRRQS